MRIRKDDEHKLWELRCCLERALREDPDFTRYRRRLWLDDDVGTRFTERSGSVSRLRVVDPWTETGRMTCGPAVPSDAPALRFCDPTRTVVTALA